MSEPANPADDPIGPDDAWREPIRRAFESLPPDGKPDVPAAVAAIWARLGWDPPALPQVEIPNDTASKIHSSLEAKTPTQDLVGSLATRLAPATDSPAIPLISPRGGPKLRGIARPRYAIAASLLLAVGLGLVAWSSWPASVGEVVGEVAWVKELAGPRPGTAAELRHVRSPSSGFGTVVLVSRRGSRVFPSEDQPPLEFRANVDLPFGPVFMPPDCDAVLVFVTDRRGDGIVRSTIEADILPGIGQLASRIAARLEESGVRVRAVGALPVPPQ